MRIRVTCTSRVRGAIEWTVGGMRMEWVVEEVGVTIVGKSVR